MPQSYAMLSSALQPEVDPEVVKLFSEMKKDKIAEIVAGDFMIQRLCTILLEKHANGHRSYIRTRARHLGRLLFMLRKLESEKTRTECSMGLIDFIKPHRFDFVVEAVKAVAISDGCFNKKDSNSMPLKLGHSLNKIAYITQGLALRRKDRSLQEDAQSFLDLLKNEWSDRVSSKCLRELYQKKVNKLDQMPLTADITLLMTSLKTEIAESTAALKNSPHAALGRHLAELCLSRIVAFNCRRGGEMARMKVEDYITAKRLQRERGETEFYDALTEFERHIAKSQLLVRIKGKRGNIL